MADTTSKSQPIPSLVEQLESADKLHHIHQVEALNAIDPSAKAAIHPLSGGAVLISRAEYGHKINRAVGLGIWSSLSSDGLDEIERLFIPTGLPVKIDMCPYADGESFGLLHRRGYCETGRLVELALDLSSGLPTPPAPKFDQQEQPAITIRRVEPSENSDFISTCVEGFLPNGRPRALLSILARIALARKDTIVYFALIDGVIAGAAGMAILETAYGKVAHLYIDSTLPTFQRRGVHGALIRARLNEAKLAGCDLAMLGAREGAGSARNAVKAGFERVYVKKEMIKKAQNEPL